MRIFSLLLFIVSLVIISPLWVKALEVEISNSGLGSSSSITVDSGSSITVHQGNTIEIENDLQAVSNTGGNTGPGQISTGDSTSDIILDNTFNINSGQVLVTPTPTPLPQSPSPTSTLPTPTPDPGSSSTPPSGNTSNPPSNSEPQSNSGVGGGEILSLSATSGLGEKHAAIIYALAAICLLFGFVCDKRLLAAT